MRAGFEVNGETGASVICGYFGDPVAAATYLKTWTAAFPRADSRAFTSMPNPQGEVWETTSVAVDGAFLEGIDDGVADTLTRAALAGRGFGNLEMGLSSGAAARVGMIDTAYPLRGRGLSLLLSSEWRRTSFMGAARLPELSCPQARPNGSARSTG